MHAQGEKTLMDSPASLKNACQLCNEIIFREGTSQLFENMDEKEGVQSGHRADLQAIETPGR